MLCALSTSSLRKQGPITTGRSFAKGVCHAALSRDHAVWVPAFAGTTSSLPRARSLHALAPFARAAALETCGRPVRTEIQGEVAKALHRSKNTHCSIDGAYLSWT